VCARARPVVRPLAGTVEVDGEVGQPVLRGRPRPAGRDDLSAEVARERTRRCGCRRPASRDGGGCGPRLPQRRRCQRWWP
jgi:hypothetical protein